MLEKTLKSSLDSKEIKPVNPKWNKTLNTYWKDWCWNSSSLATWYEEPTQWKRPCCWERLRAGGERDDRGRDGWIASPTQRIWVWVNSGSWWWTGIPGVLWSMGSQRVGHNCATELTESYFSSFQFFATFLYTFKSHWRPRRVFVHMDYIFQYLLHWKLKLRIFKYTYLLNSDQTYLNEN